jgi:prolyl-tRNA synthetase
MLQSKLFYKTLKESPKDEASVNASLLIRAGFIDKVMAGVYNYLPLGHRVLKKIENIVREEMIAIGGQEVLMPVLHPKENWQRTGRWDIMSVLFKLKGTGDKEYALGPTHEEIVTPLAGRMIFSYKDLPLAVYQIQTKFRNEPRSKAGLIRGREFSMKDLYSFHATEEDLAAYYEKVAVAYQKIFVRLNLADLTYRVYASGGEFSKYSDEFQTVCATGEDTIFIAPKAGLSFNREIAPATAPVFENKDEKLLPIKEIKGEDIIGVDELSKFLKIPVEKTTKTILFENEAGVVIAAAVRGDYDVNEIKLMEISGSRELRLADEKTVKRVTGAALGYAGILNLTPEVKVYLDDSLVGRVNFECGANRTNYHTVNVNFGRDLPLPEKFYDLKIAKEGDAYPVTGEKYEVKRAIEIGNIFKLGTKFSSAFNLNYRDEAGKQQAVIMGCYGLGPSRIMGTLAEIFHDERGLKWPESVAPFRYHLINLSKDAKVKKQALEIYVTLEQSGVEVLYDDRDGLSAGERLAEADLLGLPYRLVVSDKTAGKIEVKKRSGQAVEYLTIKEILKRNII